MNRQEKPYIHGDPTRRISISPAQVALFVILLLAAYFAPLGTGSSASAAVGDAPSLRLPWQTGSYKVTGSYGCGLHVDNSVKYHDLYAIDFGLPSGTHVAAVAPGTFHRGSDGSSNYGTYAWITHANGYVSVYAHLQSGTYRFAEGAQVNQNDWIANSGDTGAPGQYHLHFSLRRNATSISDGVPAIPEPMSGYYGFKHYGATHDTDTPTNRTCPGSIPSPSYSASQPVTRKTLLGVEVSLPAISNIGADNNNPHHPVRWMETQVFDSSNRQVVDRWDQVTYLPSSGRFLPRTDTGHLGAVDLGSTWTSGIYYVKIRLHNTLRQQVTEANCAGIYTVTNGGAILVPIDFINRPGVALVSGDINDDNTLNILDYNLLLDSNGTKEGDSKYNPTADLNDDGAVDGVDYNIWLRDSGAPPSCS